jgi:K+-transporting ATPase KdpF subunit
VREDLTVVIYVTAAVTALVVVYLFAALIRPERF